MAEFYLVDEEHKTIAGTVVELPNVLYFKLDKVGFDGKATKDHVKQYEAAYGQFKSAHPDYVPTLEDSVEIGAPEQVRVPDEVPVPAEELALSKEPALAEACEKSAA